MKLLENSKLEAINNALDVHQSGDCRLLGKIESYSCKSTASDKKLLNSLLSMEPGSTQDDLQALSPPESWFAGSPSRRHRYHSGSSLEEMTQHSFCSDTTSRKTLFFLTSTLNAAFAPDYDFSLARGDDFSREPSLTWVTNTVDSVLFQSPGQGQVHVDLQQQLWGAIDEEINLRESEIFSYTPDLSGGDPFSEDGLLWSFNFFFYNKKLKRVVFFTARAMARNVADSGMGTDEEEEEDMLFYEDDE